MKSNTICLLAAAAAICLPMLILGCESQQKAPDQPTEALKTVEPTKPVEPAKPVVKPVEPVKPVVKPVEPEKPVVKPVEPNEPKVAVKEPGPAASLMLAYKPADTGRYKVLTEADKSVLWQGPEASKPTGFKGGHTGNRIEVTFAQNIKSVAQDGNAIAEITLEAVTYLAKVRDSVVLDFDSSREKDNADPINALIGKTYTIELTPAGKVARIVDAAAIQEAVKGATTAHKRGQSLVSPEIITERHSIRTLPAEKDKLTVGATWSSHEVFDFGMMGKKSYEKVYTFKELQQADGGKDALAEMKAVPSAADAQQLHTDQQGGGLFSRMFDNQESFTGRLKLDLAAGRVLQCVEDLQSEWLAVDPAAADDEKQPSALKMTATRTYHLERID